jgi:hypothetical protein
VSAHEGVSSKRKNSNPRPDFFGKGEWILVFWTVAARLGLMLVWPARAFSCDLKDWRIIAAGMLMGANPYSQHYGPLLNWPPMWMECLYFLGRISDRFNWDFLTCVRVLLVIGDAILVLSVYRVLRILKLERRGFWGLMLGVCINPFLILLTVQQGNFDVFPAIGIVWFTYFLIRFDGSEEPIDWLCAAGSLGLAGFAKTFPLVLLPLVISSSRRLTWKVRVLGGLLCVGPALLSVAPLYVLYPDEITQHVIFYRGTPGAMGMSGLLQIVAGLAVYSRLYTIGLFLVMGLLTIALCCGRLPSHSNWVLLAAVLLMGVFLFGPGYCPQYWLWVTPLLVVAFAQQERLFRIFLAATAALVVATSVLTLGYNSDLGSFMVKAFPGDFNLKLEQVFSNSSHDLILLSLPMSAIVLIFWIYCVGILVGRFREAASRPGSSRCECGSDG